MDILRQVGAIFFVFALLGFAVWKLRRGPLNLRSRSRTLASLEQLPLTQKHTLHLVKIHDQELLIATHPQGCSILVTSRDRQRADQNPDRQGGEQ